MSKMPRLNQVLAILAGKKSEVEKAITSLYQAIQKANLFEGLQKTYETIDAEGEELPSEQKVLQLKVSDVVQNFRQWLTPVLDVTLVQDAANQLAVADVEVDGQTVLAGVPVTYLLFLEKKLKDLETFVSKLPTLAPDQQWTYSRDSDCYVTPMSWKYHTKKLPRVLEKAPATDKHPAQVEVVHEDRNVGKWKTVNQSGAIPARDQHDMLLRVRKLAEGVKKAREAANMIEVQDLKAGGQIFDYVFGKTA